VWSGFGTLAYVLRPYQLVRARRLNLPAGTTSRAVRSENNSFLRLMQAGQSPI
jgi:hypothetical protein